MRDALKPLASLLLFITACCAWSQTLPSSTDIQPQTKSPGTLEFDVVSIKQNKGDDGNSRIMFKQDGLSTTNISLLTLIGNAYNVKTYLIFGGPKWLNTTGFDVEAKVDAQDVEALKKLSPQQRNALLKPVLEERFHLKVHTETKIMPLYELVVAKGGSKLKEAPVANNKPRWTMRMGELDAEDMPMRHIVTQLGYLVQRPLIDKTGLTGEYDFTLKWTPEEVEMATSSKSSSDDGKAAPSIFTALQEQLGLKLVSSKGPVDTLVIDSADLPTEN